MKIYNAFGIAASALVGIVVGAFGMYILSTSVFGYGNSARHIADATTDVAALEQLAANQPDAVQGILKARLNGAMIALHADMEKLTSEQLADVNRLEQRAKPFIGLE